MYLRREITCGQEAILGSGTLLPRIELGDSAAPQKPVKRLSKERDDDYPKVVLRLNERWRIIECRDQYQWILQKRDSLKKANRWTGKSYCTTRKGLERAIKDKLNVGVSLLIREFFEDQT